MTYVHASVRNFKNLFSKNQQDVVLSSTDLWSCYNYVLQTGQRWPKSNNTVNFESNF